MHIPDGLLHNNIAGPALGSAGAFAALALRQVYHRVTRRIAIAEKQTVTVPQLNSSKTTSRVSLTTSGTLVLSRTLAMAGLIFLLQLIDVPLVAGIPGHLLGGAMAALILGPWAAMMSLGIVLTVQAFGMNDGGTVALGVNYLSMGIVSVWSAWGLAHLTKKKTPLTLGLSALLSVIITALTAAVFLNFNTRVFGGETTPFLLTHCIIGVVEALVTVALITILKRRQQPIAILDVSTNTPNQKNNPDC